MTNHAPIAGARAERAARDQRIYDFILSGEHPQAGVAKLAAEPRLGQPIGSERARALAARSNHAGRRPAITSARVRQLVALADLVRPRARATSTLYGLPRNAAADIRKAIGFIDDLAAWQRRAR